jgi:hypothetical protein
VAAADHLQVLERVQVLELGIVGLDVEEARDLFDGGQVFQLGGVHGPVPRAKGEVLVEVLEPGEADVNVRKLFIFVTDAAANYAESFCLWYVFLASFLCFLMGKVPTKCTHK